MYHRRVASDLSDVAAFILAGGKSTRMGTDKAFVALEGRTLLARSLEVARSVTSDVRIVGSAEKFAAFAPVVEDLFSDCGPLGGIHAALRSSQNDLNLMLAVDLPLVSFALLQFLITRAKDSGAMVTAPRTQMSRAEISTNNFSPISASPTTDSRPHEHWQPLCAVYRRDFADIAEAALQAGRYKIDALFENGSVCSIGHAELELAGFSPNMFRNLNTPEDIAGAGK